MSVSRDPAALPTSTTAHLTSEGGGLVEKSKIRSSFLLEDHSVTFYVLPFSPGSRSFQLDLPPVVQLGASSQSIHGGAYFSAVCG